MLTPTSTSSTSVAPTALLGSAAVVDALREQGAAAFNPSRDVLHPLPGNAWSAFAASWDDLRTDQYLPGGANYRQRRYGRLDADLGPGGWTLHPRAAGAFTQPVDVIPLWKGAPRQFIPVTAAFLASPVLARLLRVDLAAVTAAEGLRPGSGLTLGLHLIRVLADGQAAPPAPEGRHRDGHAYVAMHLIGRCAVTGGQSRVYRGMGDTHPFLTTTLQEPLDSLLVDDRAVVHEVTPINQDPATGGTGGSSSGGRRDMLLVDVRLQPGGGAA